MARLIYSRLRINGKLTAETPLHVGGIGGNADSDMALAINGKGEFYVPGTSITGVLRAWCERSFGRKLTEDIWGFQEKNSQIAGTKKDESHASFVLVEDATIENAKDVLTEIRDGVGIDRFYGTAADGAKYDREILPKGSKLDFKMTVEIGENRNANQIKAIFGHLLEALQNGEIRFGGSRTRGLGKLRLSLTKQVSDESLLGFDKIISALKRKIETENETTENIDTKAEIERLIKADKTTKPDSNARLEITIDWSPVQPLMVKAGFEGIGVDMLPLTSQKDGGELALVLPGSSIKGSIRSQAERIMRTLLDCEDKGERFRTKDNPNFHDQINKIPLVDEIFGAKADSGEDKNGIEKRIKKGRLGALSIDDCFAEKPFDKEIWNEITTAKTTVTNIENNKETEVSFGQQPLWQALKKIKHKPKDKTGAEIDKEIASFAVEHHNAIDRFTGGAADGALYSVLAPTKISWDKMQISLDFSRIQNEDRQIEKAEWHKCLMLLLLVLRDLAENRLPLGFATNRGMGEIEVESIELKGKNLKEIGLDGDVLIKMENGKFTASDDLKKLGGKEWWKTN
ncbi:MAG: RAMP superfamily CRISPR-associated protein [Pyrinomonadaceae bacterium]